MSYLEYTAPKGTGYSEYAYPESNYSVPAQKEGIFLELSPFKEYKDTIAGGVGPYHINHFIGYFKLSASIDPFILTKIFFNKFITIFNPENEAMAFLSKYILDSHKVIKFVLNKPLAGLHGDWITLQMAESLNSFVGKTLMKLWITKEEVYALTEFLKLMRKVTDTSGVAYLVPEEISKLTDKEFMLVNQRHFLSGRRSWAVGYSSTLDLYYVETAAFERYSHPAYLAAENIMGVRESIVNIWTKLIENYSTIMQSELIIPDVKPKGYSMTESNVFYIKIEDKSAAALKQLPWFSDVLKRHQGLLT